MKRLKIFLTIILITLFFSCTESPIGYDGYYNYPLETDIMWNYKYIIEITNYRPLDPNDPYIPDTNVIVENIRILSEGKYIFENGTVTFRLSELPLIYKNHKNTNYYISKPQELYRYAYKGMGSLAFPKTNKNLKFLFNRKYFNNTHSLIDYITGIVNTNQDSIYIEPTPRLVYKYPLTIGSKWNFVDITGVMRIDKEVIGKEILNIPAGSFQVSVIKWYYDLKNLEGSEDISVLEYVSKEGLIKRTFYIKNLALIAPESPEVKGYIDIIQDIVLLNNQKAYED